MKNQFVLDIKIFVLKYLLKIVDLLNKVSLFNLFALIVIVNYCFIEITHQTPISNAELGVDLAILLVFGFNKAIRKLKTKK